MPTIKINKPSQKQTTKQVVKQSVKVIVEAPKKKIRRKRKATVSKSSKEAKIIEQLPIYTPFYIAQPSTSQPSNVQTSAQSLTTTAFNPALDKVNNMRVEEGKKRGGLSTTTISLNEILPSAPEEIKELEPSKPELEPQQPEQALPSKKPKTTTPLEKLKDDLREQKARIESLLLPKNGKFPDKGYGWSKKNLPELQELKIKYDTLEQSLLSSASI
jgi:uncharacterized protein YicC (UPF0701 family)